VADSNYQAEQEGAHTLVALDDALKRRFTINLTMDYLSAGQEVEVLNHLLQEESAWRS
jgi:MoxR-like ATPase